MFDADSCLKYLIDNVNIELEKIVKWMNANKLSLNVEKTHDMFFRSKGRIVENTCKVIWIVKKFQKLKPPNFVE